MPRADAGGPTHLPPTCASRLVLAAQHTLSGAAARLVPRAPPAQAPCCAWRPLAPTLGPCAPAGPWRTFLPMCVGSQHCPRPTGRRTGASGARPPPLPHRHAATRARLSRAGLAAPRRRARPRQAAPRSDAHPESPPTAHLTPSPSFPARTPSKGYSSGTRARSSLPPGDVDVLPTHQAAHFPLCTGCHSSSIFISARAAAFQSCASSAAWLPPPPPSSGPVKPAAQPARRAKGRAACGGRRPPARAPAAGAGGAARPPSAPRPMAPPHCAAPASEPLRAACSPHAPPRPGPTGRRRRPPNVAPRGAARPPPRWRAPPRRPAAGPTPKLAGILSRLHLLTTHVPAPHPPSPPRPRGSGQAARARRRRRGCLLPACPPLHATHAPSKQAVAPRGAASRRTLQRGWLCRPRRWRPRAAAAA
jgi:hypothetical protein